MGTRGAYGFRINGVDKVTYNHFDSYPEGLGATILSEVCQEDLENLRKVAEGIQLVDQSNPATKEEILQCHKWQDLAVGTQKETDWYCLLRYAQGGLTAWLSGGLTQMIDSAEFLYDSLFCEYAYIVNLDEGCLEFYVGFNKDPGAEGRYVDPKRSNSNGYYGVALKGVVRLEFLFKYTEEDRASLIELWEQIGKGE